MKYLNKFNIFLNEETNESVSWDTIKKNCGIELRSKLLGRDNISIIPILAIMKTKEMIKSDELKMSSTWDFIKKLQVELEELIKDFDIREYHLLIKAFPEAFPKFVKDGNCSIDLEDKGWYFYKK